MIHLSQINAEDVQLDGNEKIIQLAKELINGKHPGILNTIDLDGYPRSRWMATLSFDDFPVFYTLTAPGSRKVPEIVNNPSVSWIFFNQDLSLIMNLRGQARILRDVPTLKRVWHQIKDKSLAYFLNNYSEGLGFVVIETRAKSVECTTPKNAFRLSVDLNEIHPVE